MLKHPKRKPKIKKHSKYPYHPLGDGIYIIPYSQRYPKIYKSVIVKLKNIYVSAYENNEKFRYKSNKHIKKYIKWLIKRCGNTFYLIYCDNKQRKQLIGFIGVEYNWYEKTINEKGAIIHEFVIDSHYQSKGIGKKALLYVLEEIKKYNIKNIILSVGDTNTRAIKFYEKLGFKKVLKEENKNNISWIYMKKSL